LKDELDEFGEHPLPTRTRRLPFRNDLLDQAYEVCEAAGLDICEVGLEEYIDLVTGELPSGDDES
jgi:hypothetical protein